MLRRVYARLSSLWNWRRKESELDEEIQFHLSAEAAERAAAGLTGDQARLAATRDFGNVTLIREQTREAWGWGGAERLVQDARCALRMIRRDPSLSAVAVLTLALGIGATTAILNVVNGLLLRPLPFTDANELVVLFATTPQRGIYRDTTSFHDFSAWKDESNAFSYAAAYRQDTFSITGDGVPEPVPGLRATDQLLPALGVNPVIGRTFNQEEQHANRPVAIISHRLWTRRYNSDPQMLGRTILLNEVNYAVVGVLPPGFQFPAFQNTDVIVPVPERPCRSCGYIRGVARLKPGVPASNAQYQLDAIAASREKAFPDSNEGRGVNVVPLQDVAVGPVRTPLLVLLGAGVFVLLIGCGNVGNLVLARGIARQREFALRNALGAGARRLVRQLLAESIAVAFIAALLGALLAWVGSELLLTSLSQRVPLPAITFNWTLLAFVLLIAVMSGLLSGLPPALMVWKADLNAFLKQDTRSQTGSPTQHRLRNLLVVSQTALTVMLLVGAGLFMKSFVLLQQVDLGLNPRQVLTADLLLSTRYANLDRRDVFLEELLHSMHALPGVQHAAVTSSSVLGGGGSRETITIEGQADPSTRNGHPVAFNMVAGDFFRALDIARIQGRDFDSRDRTGGVPVAIINETMARQFWPEGNAVGKRIRFFYDKDPQRWLSIVGVVRDSRYRYTDAMPQVFVPYPQNPYRSLPYAASPFVSLVVRTATEPAGMTSAVQAGVWAVDKDQPILNVQPIEYVLWQSVAEPRTYTLLLGIFASLALAIASAGIYGLSTYAVVRRTHEIGIRLAVGATSAQILTMVMRQGFVLLLVGFAVGVAGSLALRQVVAGLLFGITATDSATFVTVFALFAAVAFVATFIPARRAARIDPTIAFRYE